MAGTCVRCEFRICKIDSLKRCRYVKFTVLVSGIYVKHSSNNFGWMQ